MFGDDFEIDADDWMLLDWIAGARFRPPSVKTRLMNDLYSFKVGTPAAEVTPVIPPAIPLTHQSHPIWHVNWTVILEVLQAAAKVAPLAAAVAAPGNAGLLTEVNGLSALAGAVTSATSATIEGIQP